MGQIPGMIRGAHVLLFSKDADADRAFLQNVLQFRAVDAGYGWLIFALPPSEVAVHPAETQEAASVPDLPASLYLMCDDIRAFIKSMEAKEVVCSSIVTERWGLRTSMRLPSGGELGVYQPTHPTAI
jgi:catechol 2,3-dioxygenase-like lactoylglutathione lyase family enzyme